MNRRLVLSVVVVAACFAGALAYKFVLPKPLEFVTVAEAKAAIEQRGFYCIYTHEQSGRVLIVSDHPMSLDEARLFEVERMAASTDRKGKAVVMGKASFDSTVGEWKLWGEVSATGDAEFMNRLESALNR